MKIYTKTGDQGTTSVYGGKRVLKNDQRIKIYGDVDELNSHLGVCLALVDQSKKLNKNDQRFLQKSLLALQHQLFVLGADLAAPLNLKLKTSRLSEKDTIYLEKQIDLIEKKLPPITNFILPGGSLLAAHLHLARTICRRTERGIVTLIKSATTQSQKINPAVVPFINRLSDYLFVMARFANQLNKTNETKWKL